MDFYKIKHRIKRRPKERDLIEIYPDFKVCRSADLMVRAKSFYAVWDEDLGMWSTDEYDVQRLVDDDLYHEAERIDIPGEVVVKSMSDFSSKSWVDFRNYMSHISDSHHPLDENLTFSNTPVNKSDYVSKRLPYPLSEGSIAAYDEIMSTLYNPEERAKLEWAIGSIVAGDSKNIQKFIVLYGEAGAGKSTVLNIVQQLFQGYYTTFEAKALASSNNSFSTEAFKSNPLVAIQHDGDLSKIEDNTKLNSIISHEEMLINEKFKPSYTSRFNCFLFMATNRPVKITDAKSGLVRRLIDVSPSGNKIPFSRYQALMSQVSFELGAIAYHCLKVYQEMGKHYYDAYRPIDMMFKTDVFFNFVEDSYYVFSEQDGVSLKAAFAMYKEYCEDAKASYILPRYKFREELKNYFDKFYDTTRIEGKQVRSYFQGFKSGIFEREREANSSSVTPRSYSFECEESIFDELYSDCPAQYASSAGTPLKKWADVDTTLADIDTTKLHYVKLPENHIVIDFDIKGEDGQKSFQKNLEAVENWPMTYGELSKSGEGIHLHYIYNGDASKLSRLYSENVEVKVFSGNSSLRRKLTKCNDVPIATIDSGLPMKKEKKMINFNTVQSERGVRKLLERNLRKEIHPGTKPSIDFIYKILDDAYKSGMYYDVTDMRPRILAFANNSTNQADYCLKLVNEMKFHSDEISPPCEEYLSDEIIFFDVEVFPNLFLINWKQKGEGKRCVRMINPTSADVEELLRLKLVGFNCRRYDNHILYARYLGYNNHQLYELSKKIIGGSKNAMFKEAYNISYTDVYDFASAGNKKSLKKWEIDLGIHHQELGLPWDEPVPEDRWIEVAEYCDNDVLATEVVFDHLKADWTARQILADIAEMTVNDTTNQLSTRIIFGRNREPQSEFNYRNLAEPIHELDPDTMDFLKEVCPTMMSQLHGEEQSLLPYFPGYKFVRGKSTYRGEEVGEGGYVYSEPGMYSNVALLDITSMHPHSVISECLFGPRYTKRFYELVYGRVDIKHEEWDEINDILDGKLTKYVDLVKSGEMSSWDLANGLKTAINSVYGLTSAGFSNAFKDPRNKDNIVAKRGALFMIDLKHEVQSRGYTVAHIKTDSIKIPDADKEIIDFVCEFGEKYGYHFEHEATYEKMCLVNKSTYIARYPDDPNGNKKIPWVAVGAQFQHPYVFKTLFSKQPVEFSDLIEAKSVKTSIYLDFNEDLPEDEHNYIFVGHTGAFTPVLPGTGGALLMRKANEDKYDAVTGSKGYRWRESEMVEKLDKTNDVDMNYFNALVDEAVDDISKYGDFEWFVDELPPWEDNRKDNDEKAAA